MALKIAKKEKANIDIVKIVAYLHDVGRKEEMLSKGKICHAGRKIAQERHNYMADFFKRFNKEVKGLL